MVARSGQRAELEWNAGEEESLLLFRPEAVVGSNGLIIDLCSEFALRSPQDGGSGLGGWKRNAAVTLPDGRERVDEVGRVDGVGGAAGGVEGGGGADLRGWGVRGANAERPTLNVQR